MGDPTPEIESELGRHIVTQEQTNEHRKRLNESFAKLSQDQAAALLERLLKVDGSALPSNFRRLHRANRVALLNRLAMHSDQASERFHSLLTAAGDTPGEERLAASFPGPHENQSATNSFRDWSRKTPTGIPVVQLEFRANSDGIVEPGQPGATHRRRERRQPETGACSRIAEKTTWKFAAS